MLYILKRTQLYLDEDVWNALKARARAMNTTISELVREAVRERYVGKFDQRRKAMLAFAGARKDLDDSADTEGYLRALRRGDRVERVRGK
jgi:hypothetical protein